MRGSFVVLFFGATACGALSSSDVEEVEAAGAASSELECAPPSQFEADYSDGRALIKARQLADEPGTSAWSYYSPPGKLAIIEVRKNGHITHVTTYHSNGKPYMHGDVVIDSESGEPRAEGLWEINDDEGDLVARALISDGELHQGSAQAWDRDGLEMEWSLPENVFTYRESEPTQPIRASVPANAFGQHKRKQTCTMVCLDESGDQLGIYRLAHAAPGLNEASELAIREARFHPRQIGGIGMPSCRTESINYETIWATKLLRLPRPIQRRPRHR